MHKAKLTLLLLVPGLMALLTLGGCGGGPRMVTRTNFVEFSPEQQLEINAKAGQPYRIQEGDILGVAFSYEKSLTQNGVMVLNDGSISLMGVDRLEVAGKTVTEVDSLLTQIYAKEYLEPELSIIIEKARGRMVYVMGEVKSPGRYALQEGGFDILGAISLAGGFNEDAAKAGTVLVRVTDSGYLVQEVDMSDISSMSAVGLATITLQPFDVVYVPRSRAGDFNYFSKTILAGIGNITRIAGDLKYLSTGGYTR